MLASGSSKIRVTDINEGEMKALYFAKCSLDPVYAETGVSTERISFHTDSRYVLDNCPLEDVTLISRDRNIADAICVAYREQYHNKKNV